MNRRAVVVMLVVTMVSIGLAVLVLGGGSDTGTPGSGHPNGGVNGELFCSRGHHHPPGSSTTCVPDSP